MGILMILVVLEGTRRTMGPALTVIAILFLLYAFLGPFFPPRYGTKALMWSRLVSFLYSTTEGIFCLPDGDFGNLHHRLCTFRFFSDQSGAGTIVR